MNYTLHQLEIFLEVANYKSVTKAAEVLNLTQPAVSIQLRNFQNNFDLALTEVIGRKLYITDFGLEVAEISKRILEEAKDLKMVSHSHKGQLTGKLRISSVSTGKYVIPYFLSDFLRLNPGVELQLNVTNKRDVMDSLEKNEVDFGFVSILPDKMQVNNMEIMENKLFIVGKKSNQKHSNSLKLSELTNFIMIFREEGSATRLAMENFLSKNKSFINKKFELASNEAVKQAVLAGLGYSLMPVIGIQNELADKKLEIIPVDDLPIVTKWNLIWHTTKKTSAVSKAFLKYIEENRDQIIENNFKQIRNY